MAFREAWWGQDRKLKRGRFPRQLRSYNQSMTEDAALRNRQSRVGVLALVYIFVVVVWGAYYGGLIPASGPDSVLDGQLEHLIKTELPLGASTSQVKAWLVSKKVNIIVYQNKDLDMESSVSQSRFKPNQLSGIIGTRLDTGHSIIGYNVTLIDFFFDKKGGLIGHFIQRGGIGL